MNVCVHVPGYSMTYDIKELMGVMSKTEKKEFFFGDIARINI